MRNAEQQVFLDEVSEHFTLMLLYIHSWNFSYQNRLHPFSFKTVDFDVLRLLHNNELIVASDKRSDYIQLTPEGVAMAKDFMLSLTQLDI